MNSSSSDDLPEALITARIESLERRLREMARDLETIKAMLVKSEPSGES